MAIALVTHGHSKKYLRNYVTSRERGGLCNDSVSVEIGLPGSDRNSTVQRGPAVRFCASSYNVDLVKTIKAGSK